MAARAAGQVRIRAILEAFRGRVSVDGEEKIVRNLTNLGTVSQMATC